MGPDSVPWWLVVAVFCFAQHVLAHVSLTFPPARKYDLDFLDSFRTKAPCGMPPGKSRTSFLSGGKFNVTWHLGYPHRGGFKIQLLDDLERPVLDLTPSINGSQYVTDDGTAQRFEVQLPPDYTCSNCTLRLLRQATEWGMQYKFWSCADVDIKTRREYRETCSGHGKFYIDRCKCDRLYYGERCEYRNECLEDKDCGPQGKCINIEATTAPERHCYCKMGWFGTGCTRRSHINSTNLNLQDHFKRELSPDFHLYWKILPKQKEIEMVMIVNTTSYVAIGWRPLSLTPACRNWPLIKFPNSKAPEPAPEPKSEPEPSPEPKSEPEPSPEPNSEPEPSPEPETTPEPVSPKSVYFRRSASNSQHFDDDENEGVVTTSVSYKVSFKKGRRKRSLQNAPEFNPMDCTDIIIGTARGNYNRIGDYYTRDRSTPRQDAYWGGRNDLTAALGFESDGVTTVLFRRKLTARDPSDHPIEDEFMHVIWAKGQELGKYVHFPKSSLEAGNASLKNFYKPDELKYHGHGRQRGMAIIDFMEEKKKPKDDAHCIGNWKMPKHCSPENGTCEYYAEWRYSSRNDEIHFNVRTVNSGAWTGIAFSEDTRMANSDAILGGWVDNLGKPFIMDTWIQDYSPTGVKLDESQDIYNLNGSIIDGVMSLSFTRKRTSTDPKDLSFTDDDCLYVFFPTHGGRFDFVSKKIWKHNVTPYISSEKICIRSCDNELDDGGAIESGDNPNDLKYNVEIKIIDLGENFQFPKPNSLDYEDLKAQINDNFKPLFKKIPGYKKFKLTEIKEDNKNIIANMNFQLDKSTAGKGRSFDDDETRDEEVEKVIKDSIISGSIGRFIVDKNYLNFEPQHLTRNINPELSSEDNGNFFNLSETKLYIVLGCIAALILVAIVQASCTIYKTASRSSSSHKRVYSVQLDPIYYQNNYYRRESLPHWAASTSERNRHW